MTQPPDTTRPGFSIIATIGGLLVGIGAVILAFVLFMVFGTALIQGSHQQSLRTEFERVFPAPGHTAPGPPRTVAAATPPPLGAPVAQIQIPALSLNMIVVQGTSEPDLEQGPGHYVGTPLPGEPGNVAIAGHRTTWGHPFNRLDQLRLGQAIIVTTPQGRFTFRVQWIAVVAPTDLAIITHTTGASLTLTTCNPKYSAATRLVVHAALAGVGVPTVHELQTLRRISLPTTLAIVPSSAGGWLAGLWGTMALSVLAALFIGVARRRWVALALLPLFGCCFLMCSYWLSGLLPQSF